MDRLKLDKFNLFVIFFIAFFAAAATLFFALNSGIRSTGTIVWRVFLSFLIFTVTGFLARSFLDQGYLQGFLLKVNKANLENDVASGEELLAGQAVDEQAPAKADDVGEFIDNDALDKIVVVNKDAE